jgi:hypothetical protein
VVLTGTAGGRNERVEIVQVLGTDPGDNGTDPRDIAIDEYSFVTGFEIGYGEFDFFAASFEMAYSTSNDSLGS